MGDLGVRALGLAPGYPDTVWCVAAVVCNVDTSVLVVIPGEGLSNPSPGRLARFKGVDVPGFVEGVYNAVLAMQDVTSSSISAGLMGLMMPSLRMLWSLL